MGLPVVWAKIGYMRSFTNTRPQPGEQLDAVANDARLRLLVSLLNDHSLGETPIEITDWMDGTDTATSRTAMEHTHLPKLEHRGFIQWDRCQDLVTHGPQFGEIEPLLTVLYEHRDELPDEWL